MNTETVSSPNPCYDNFDDFVSSYCNHFAHLVCCSAADVRNGMCDIAELRKSYENGELAGDTAWNDYESAL